MVNDKQQDGKAEVPAAPAANPQLTPKGASRRRIAGLGLSGVVLTVASNNAMAAIVCKSPSGALSGALASQSPNLTCNALSPGYWKNHTSAWPSDVLVTDLFSKHFSCQGNLASKTCLQILDKQGADKNNVAMHMMATYLNVAAGYITFLTRDEVKSIWFEYNTTGVYVPASGAKAWTGKELTAYLASTMA